MSGAISTRRRIAALACTAVAALAAAAGSTSSAATSATPAPVTVAAGKVVFKSTCAGCHVLANAKSHGTLGPNLDRLKPDLKEVVKQVTKGGGGMPAFGGRLSKTKIQAVAKYVSSVAGKGKPSPPSPGGLP